MLKNLLRCLFFAITVEIFRTCDDYLISCTLRVTSSCIIKLVFIIWCLQFPLYSFIRRRNIYFSHVTIFSHQIYSYLQGDSIEKCHEQIKMPSLKPHFGLINIGSEMQSLGALIFFFEIHPVQTQIFEPTIIHLFSSPVKEIKTYGTEK